MSHLMLLALGVVIAAATAPALAHVTLDRGEAPAGSYFKAVLRVPHGCKGSPTHTVRVRIPPGVSSAKPQPKPGWTTQITRSTLPKPIDAGHGRMVSEVVSEIAWSGAMLADEHFDEFGIVMKLPDTPGATLYVPVVQVCAQGTHRWIETPTPGRDASALKEPAPALRLLPRQ